MPFRIDRPTLDDFIARQVDLVESTPVPSDIASVVAGAAADGLTPEELHAVWLGAGLATQIGLAILEEPERFIAAAPLTVATA